MFAFFTAPPLGDDILISAPAPFSATTILMANTTRSKTSNSNDASSFEAASPVVFSSPPRSGEGWVRCRIL